MVVVEGSCRQILGVTRERADGQPSPVTESERGERGAFMQLAGVLEEKRLLAGWKAWL